MNAKAKTCIESFDGPSGWMSWAGPLQPVRPEVRDGAQLVLLAQGNIARDKDGNVDWVKPNVVNQVLTAQPFAVTPEWSEQIITPVPDQKQWTQLGSHEDAGYGQGPIEELLRDVNFDLIFILFPLDVRPLRPVQGDHHRLRPGRDCEVDRSRLPEGSVMLHEVRIEYP
jgi:hypothetical protein